MERERVLRILHDDLAAAQKRRDEASKRFSEVLRDVTPEAAECVRRASHEYGVAQQEARHATIALNTYLRCGIVPLRLKPKCAAEKTPKDRKTTTSERISGTTQIQPINSRGGTQWLGNSTA